MFSKSLLASLRLLASVVLDLIFRRIEGRTRAVKSATRVKEHDGDEKGLAAPLDPSTTL